MRHLGVLAGPAESSKEGGTLGDIATGNSGMRLADEDCVTMATGPSLFQCDSSALGLQPPLTFTGVMKSSTFHV